MKSNILKYVMCTATALGLAASVQADPIITGGISFAGGVVLSGGTQNDFLHATTMTFQNVVVVAGQETGSFSALNGGYAFTGTDAFGPMSINPLPATLGTLYSFTANGLTYSLISSTESLTFANSTTIVIDGTGTMNITGFAPTLGTWNVTANQKGQETFSFSSSAAAGLPDGGTTAILLGAALSGLGLLRRKLA